MRHAAEFRRAWKDASGVAMDVGKKLLGYLANQKRLSGVDSLVQRVTLDDGTIVEARWDKDLPTVRVYPPGSLDAACEMYVESGLLDLGPNIASDAGDRFNPGLPEFDDARATLYFGTGVDCSDGLNGTVNMDGTVLRSQCLAEGGSAVPSRLASPAKKQAQAALPASCWSGRMQRYIQAVYGGDTLNYTGNATTLALPNATLPVADTIGLLDFDGTLAFLIIDGAAMTLRAVAPSSLCVRAVLQAWAQMSPGTAKDKVLTIALSGCLIGEVIATGTIVTGNRHFVNRAPWVFAHDSNTAVAVFEDAGVATAYEATFSLAGSAISASLTTLTSGNVLNTDLWPLLVADQSPYVDPVAHASGFGTSEDPLEVGQAWDFPVYAYYNGATPVVVACSVVTSDAPLVDVSTCYDTDTFTGPAIVGSDTSRQSRSDLSDSVSVAYGFYTADWSSVRLVTAYLDPSDDATVVRTRSAGFQGMAITGAMTEYTWDDSVVLEASFALYGPYYDGCIARNQSVGSGGEPDTVRVPADVPCTVFYHDATDSTFSDWTASRPYVPVSLVVFEGDVSGSGLQVLSLAWGATDCLVVDRYDFTGGKGAYGSADAALHVLVGLFDPAYSYTAYTATYDSIIKTEFATPGDCGSPQTHTTLFDAAFAFTSTMQAIAVDVALPMYGAVSPVRDGSALIALDCVAVGGATVTTRVAPRCRGLETAASEVFMPGADSDDSVSREVDVFLPDSPYEHPDGPGTFVADPDVAGDCDAFELLGLQGLSDNHLQLDLATGDSQSLVLQDAAPTWLVDGFAYRAGRSLLGAALAPVATVQRGNSIGMDRQTITGGYPIVNTPSFIGWA